MKKLFAFVFICASFLSKSQVQICAGSSTVLNAASPSSLSAYSYTLNPGNFNSSSPAYTVSPNVTTTYTLITKGPTTASPSVTGSTSVVITVSVFSQPIMTPSFTQASCTSTINCFNLNLTWNPPAAPPAYTVSWAPLTPNSTIPTVPSCITGSNVTQTSCCNVSPGNYQAIVTSANGCVATTAIFTITPQLSPASFSTTPSGNSFSITCYNPSVSLVASNPNNTYTWSSTSFNPLVSPSITLNGANQGTLTVTGTNTVSNCSATRTISIQVNTTVPVSSISPTIQTVSSCTSNLQTITLTAVSPSVNLSHIVAPPQGGTFVANTPTTYYAPQGGTGIYQHCLIDNSNGCQVCKTFTVNAGTGYASFTVTSSPPGFTVGCSTTSLVSIKIPSASASVPGGAVTYTFLPPGSSTVLPATGTLGLPSLTTIATPGTWTVVTRDGPSGCDSRIPVTVVQNTASPVIDTLFIPFPILDCTNKTTTMQVISETNNVAFNWAIPGTPVLNVGSSSLAVAANFTNTSGATPTLTGNYTLTIKDNGNLCVTTTVVPIYQSIFTPTGVGASATPTAITCITPTVTLTYKGGSSITSNFPHGRGTRALLWQGPSPVLPGSQSSTFLAPISGIYTVTAEDLDNGCTTTATVSLGDGRIYPGISFTGTNALTPLIDCGAKGATITTALTPSFTGATYTWTPPEIIPGGTLTTSSVIATAVGIYTLVVTDPSNGCATKTVTPKVEKATLTGSVEADVTFGYAPLTVTFFNNSFSGINSTSSITTAWGFGNGTSTITPNSGLSTSAVYTQPGTYTVTAFISKSPCAATSTLQIKVEAPAKLEVPNVFTPNDDNVNDLFLLHTTNISYIDMKIFDRWGHKVYELSSTTGNVAWDGKNQLGVECAQGVYFYVLKAQGKDGQTWDQKGNISLFR